MLVYTAQVLLLCVKSCLPALHNYLEIDGIAPQIRKNRLTVKMVFLLLIFKWKLGCFSLSSRLFCYEIASFSCCVCFFIFFIFICFVFFLFLRFFNMCVCSILMCICIIKILNVNSVSSLDEPFRLLEQILQ